jgi:hypothetical protein
MIIMRHSCLIALFVLCVSRVSADWHDALWLGRGDVWRARFPVTVTNPGDGELDGQAVALTVGGKPGQAPLVGARAEALRVADSQGRQLLYALWTPEMDRQITTGAVPVGAVLSLPAVCAPATSTTYHVYFDNACAWGLADFFDKRPLTDTNGDFERGSGDTPAGWRRQMSDATHRLTWSIETPFSGTRCLKAEASSGAASVWFGFSRSDFTVVPGARCTIRVRVRGENVTGTAGWYVHVGDEKNLQRINRVEKAGDGTFGWKEMQITFTVPEGATRMATGSVLYGTGTAWYDAFSFESDRPVPMPSARAGAVERLELIEQGADAPWPAELRGRRSNWLRRAVASILPRYRVAECPWRYRLPIRVVNLRDTPATNLLAVADLASAARGIVAPEFRMTFNGETVETCRLGDRLLFSCSPSARSLSTYYLYVADTGKRPEPSAAAASTLGSDIPSDQILTTGSDATDAAAFAKLLVSPVNQVKNPSFEEGTEQSDGWSHSSEGKGVRFAIESPGGFGQRHARMTVDKSVTLAWRGWYQSVPIKAGHTYLYGAWLACEDLEGSAMLHAHLRNAQGQVTAGGFLGAGAGISGTTTWTPMFGTVTVPADASVFQLHLTMEARGTLKHDGAFLAECLSATAGDPETPPMDPDELTVWPVDPVIKVFHETLPPAQPEASAIALARNEEEALQLALRAGRDIADLEIAVDPPKRRDGQTLDTFTIGWVGYVPIDHPTSYYSLTTPTWQLKHPTRAGSSDGWSGWWPDPIRPAARGALRANQTQAVWVSFKATATTKPGTYAGNVRILDADKRLVQRVPFTVTVWDFELPTESTCAAIYDIRLSPQWTADGSTAAQQRERLMRVMADKRVSPDDVGASPVFTRDEQGRITADFTAYDRAAQLYFDELKFRFSYTPGFFYLFGWEHPPKKVMGEAPYEGEHPYADADRTRLRAAYKETYQTCLRLYWDHVKAKGWADRLVLYISDEPFLTKKPIIDQMKALCDMIHEVDPKIPIYCSTWRHCPDWNGYLDVWGVGHYGCFPLDEMRARRAAGDRIWFTTDGQMCTDTPFCAVERLLPHYCFHFDAEAYEFWGVSWLTYDPWQFGWHRYIHQSSTPGEFYYVRYPNGDGYLLYPGAPVGSPDPVTTVRLEAARDGVEDYEYLKLLQRHAGNPQADALLKEFAALVEIPNAGGRFSTRILPDPSRLAALRLRAGALLEQLTAR